MVAHVSYLSSSLHFKQKTESVAAWPQHLAPTTVAMEISSELSVILGLSSDAVVIIGDEKFGEGGFLSYRRCVTVRKTPDTESINLFVKVSDMTRTELNEAQAMSHQFCKNECSFYGVMAPILDRTFTRCHLHPPYPKSFGERITESGSILVMEDLMKQGFSLVDGKLLSLEQAKCAVTSMAKMQAAYWISRDSLGNTMDSVLFGRESLFFEYPRKSGLDMKPMVEHGFQSASEKLNSYVKSKEDQNLIMEGIAMLKNMILLDMAGKLPKDSSKPLGIVHGDFWPTNIMFKECGDSLECRIVDWQLWHIGTFGLDLGQMMLTCLSHDVLEKEMESLTSLHYRVFKETFETKTGQEVPFSEEKAHEILVEGLISGCMWVFLTSNIVWDRGFIDVSNSLSNVAMVLRRRIISVFNAVMATSN